VLVTCSTQGRHARQYVTPLDDQYNWYMEAEDDGAWF
jgi:hypothetical protein